jgi:hypothetical protein
MKTDHHKTLYQIAAAAALIALLVALADVVITFFPQGAAPDPGMGAAIDWFMLFQRSSLMGLRGLGLFNIFNMLCTSVVVFALYTAHQRISSSFTTLVAMLYLAAAIIYIANNVALPMAALSEKYAAATSEVQRSVIAAAGEALLARGEDFTPGSFPGFSLSELALIAMSILMLRARLFSRLSATIGLIGFALLTLFTIWSTFIPSFYDVAMLIAMVGGLLSLAWYFLIALRFFRLAQSTSEQTAPEAALNQTLTLNKPQERA